MEQIDNVLKLNKFPNPITINKDECGVVTKEDLNPLELLFIESPLILIPNHSLKSLIKSGRACSKCGEVIKAYDSGIIKDIKKNLDGLKHERFLKGLDCDQCNIKWCCSKCKELDIWHDCLNHRPINKSNTNQIGKDTIFWENLVNLKMELEDPIKFGVFNCILECQYDSNVKELFESLPLDEIDLKLDWGKFQGLINETFKNSNYDLDTIKKYVGIYQRNNYDGSIYLIFSNLRRGEDVDSDNDSSVNCKMELFNKDQCKSFDEIDINTHLIKHINNKMAKLKPIYTSRGSNLNKKLIQCKSISNLTSGQMLIIENLNYSNPKDNDDDDIIYWNESGFPKIIIPHEDINIKIKRRTSLTSSGASFGEGIIKYNREQIREMLQTSVIEENSDYLSEKEEEENDDDDNEEDDDDDIDEDEMFQKMKDLNVSTRRKSVRFVDDGINNGN